MNNQEGAQVRARVCLSQGDQARLLLHEREYRALLRGALSAEEIFPVTGDWVRARFIEPELMLIEELFPRKSKIARRAAGRESREQILAVNVDMAFIVCGLDGDFNVRRLERYLAMVQDGGVDPVVVLNKIDIYPNSTESVRAARDVARSTRILVLSAMTGEGMAAMEELLSPNMTAVLLGSSGAGKSSILNRLLGRHRQHTNAVREHDSRGKHTTTSRELIVLPNGASIIDTPGLRELQLPVGSDALNAVFDEIAELAKYCRYRDCRHEQEPGCVVRDGVDQDRLESFRKLARDAERLNDERTEKQRWRAITKAHKRFYKERNE